MKKKNKVNIARMSESVKTYGIDTDFGVSGA